MLTEVSRCLTEKHAAFQFQTDREVPVHNILCAGIFVIYYIAFFLKYDIIFLKNFYVQRRF